MPKDVNAAVATIKTKRTMDILKMGWQHPAILGSLLEFILQLIRARYFQTPVFSFSTWSCVIEMIGVLPDDIHMLWSKTVDIN